MKKKNSGITLIALVITIIVLLILAGVALRMVAGNEGILSKAEIAASETEIANEGEIINLAYTAALIENNGKRVSEDSLQEELDKLIGDGKTEVKDIITELNVQFTDSKNFYGVTAEGIKISSEPEYIEFSFDSTNYYMTGIEELIGDIAIPSIFSYDNKLYKVTEIGEKAFYNLTGITSVSIPDSVRVIKNMAFQYCKDLEEIKISNNLVEIGVNSFYGCSELKSIYIPKTVSIINYNAFSNCSNLESVILEDGLESFCPPQSCFNGCPKLTEIEFPNSIISFNLERASGITKVTIPVSVVELKQNMLAIANLETIIFSGVCPVSIDSKVFCSSIGTIAAINGFATKLKNIYVEDELVDEFKTKFGEITYDGTNLAKDLIKPISSINE